MDANALKNELENAYKKLTEAEQRIKDLLVERNELQFVLQILQIAGFIQEGKLEEARQIAKTFFPHRD